MRAAYCRPSSAAAGLAAVPPAQGRDHKARESPQRGGGGHLADTDSVVPNANSADDTVHSLTPRLPGVSASALAITANGSAAASCQSGSPAPMADALTAPISTSKAKRNSDIAKRRRPTLGASSGDSANPAQDA